MKHWTNWTIAITLAAFLAACSDGGPMSPADGNTRVSPGAGTTSSVCAPGTEEQDPRIRIPEEDAQPENAPTGCSEDERPAFDPRIRTGETSG